MKDCINPEPHRTEIVISSKKIPNSESNYETKKQQNLMLDFTRTLRASL